MSEHIAGMGKGKSGKGKFFSKKKSASGGKKKFSLFKKSSQVDDTDNDDM
jgi:hypothetical protein